MSKKNVDKEVHISLEDQQKINKFARLNSRLEDLKDEVKAKENLVQTMDDASTGLLLLEDDEEKVPYQLGGVFVYVTQEEAQEMLEKEKDDLAKEISNIKAASSAIRDDMSTLKTSLYAKFGNAINLEANEE